MKPPAFDYLAPADVAAALDALGEHGDDAKVMAGGQSLMAMLNMRLLAPEIVVDIARIEALRFVRTDEEAGTVSVGATITQAGLQRWPDLERALPLVARALPFVGHYQTRSRGTVCGSIAHADPSAELSLCLAMLDGVVHLRSVRGGRRLAAGDFQEGMLSTACEPDELIEAVTFRRVGADERCGFAEFSRRHGDFAIVSAAVIVGRDRIRIGIGGTCDRPAVATLEAAPVAAREAVAAFVETLPIDDTREYPARYRREVAVALAARAIEGSVRVSTLERHRRHRVRFDLNGREVAGDATPRMLLSDFLRDVVGATGTHVGCEHGICGACTVRVDGEPVRSCLMLAVQAHGRAVRTVEGLGGEPGRLGVLQQAFRRHHALQCGFCTAGILMSLDAFLEREAAPTEAQVRDVLSGHLCRCTGYAPIVDAALDAARLLAEPPAEEGETDA